MFMLLNVLEFKGLTWEMNSVCSEVDCGIFSMRKLFCFSSPNYLDMLIVILALYILTLIMELSFGVVVLAKTLNVVSICKMIQYRFLES